MEAGVSKRKYRCSRMEAVALLGEEAAGGGRAVVGVGGGAGVVGVLGVRVRRVVVAGGKACNRTRLVWN